MGLGEGLEIKKVMTGLIIPNTLRTGGRMGWGMTSVPHPLPLVPRGEVGTES